MPSSSGTDASTPSPTLTDPTPKHPEGLPPVVHGLLMGFVIVVLVALSPLILLAAVAGLMVSAYKRGKEVYK